MRDRDEAIRDAVRKHEPPADWLDRVQARVRRKRRNQRVLAATVGIGLSVAVLVPLALKVATHETVPGGDAGPAAGTPPCGISTPLTGWWRWDGSDTDEVAGRKADLLGDATFAPGLVGEALTLDGDGDYASVPDDPGLRVGAGDFTIALWVRFDSTEDEQVLAEMWVQRAEERSTGWTLTKLSSNSIGFFTEGVGGKLGAASLGLDLPLDTWLHFAAGRSGNTVRIFLDGSLIASHRGPIGDLDSSAPLKLGHRGGQKDTPGSDTDQGFFLNGQIDETVFVVGRALSAQEIRVLFETPDACPP